MAWKPRRGGGYSGFQVTGMIEWEQNSKTKKISTASNNPPKIPGPKFQPPKNPMPNFQAKNISRKQKQSQNKICFTLFMELHGRVIWIHQKIPTSIKLPQKILAKILLPKKIPKSKISNLKRSFDHPCHLKSGVPPPPLALKQWNNTAEMVTNSTKMGWKWNSDKEKHKYNTLDRDMASFSICKTMGFEIHLIQWMYVPLKDSPYNYYQYYSYQLRQSLVWPDGRVPSCCCS